MQVGKIVSGTARNIVAGHAYVVLEVRGESTEINDYMAANVETTVKGLAAAYECALQAHPHGRGRDLQGATRRRSSSSRPPPATPEGVTLVTDMNAKVGSEDCTMLIRRIQAHGGKCAFFYFGATTTVITAPTSRSRTAPRSPVGWGVFTGFVAHQCTMTPITPE